MKAFIFYLFLNFIFVIGLYCQNYTYKYTSSIEERIDEYTRTNEMAAIHLADSLVLYSNTPSKEIKARIISVNTWEKCGDYNKAIEAAYLALAAATEAKDYVDAAKINIKISDLFKDAGSIKHGQVYLDNAKKLIDKLQTPEKNILQGEYFIENGKYYLEKKQYQNADLNFQLARSVFSGDREDKDSQNYDLAKVEYHLGMSRYVQKQYSIAKRHFEKALKYIDIPVPSKDKDLAYAWIYNGLGNSYLKARDTIGSEAYLQKSLIKSKNVSCDLMKQSIYGDALGFYKMKKNLDSVAVYSEKYIAITEKINRSQKEFFKANFSTKKESAASFADYWPYTIVFIGLLFSYSLHKFQKKKIIKTPKKLVLKDEGEETITLPIETEIKILSKMDCFEKTHKYLNKNMTSALLATQLETNSKYLRYVLKKHKRKDYATYINDLRVTYIQHKLDTDEKYLHYKISYLADEAGFSSHSKFSKSFKKVTNYCPSEYIEQVEEVLV